MGGFERSQFGIDFIQMPLFVLLKLLVYELGKTLWVVLPHADPVECENDQVISAVASHLAFWHAHYRVFECKVSLQLVAELLGFGGLHGTWLFFFTRLVNTHRHWTIEEKNLAKRAKHNRVVTAESGIKYGSAGDQVQIGRYFFI